MIENGTPLSAVDASGASAYRSAMVHSESDVTLTERRALIFGLIVREHIAHGQPVSSHCGLDIRSS